MIVRVMIQWQALGQVVSSKVFAVSHGYAAYVENFSFLNFTAPFTHPLTDENSETHCPTA